MKVGMTVRQLMEAVGYRVGPGPHSGIDMNVVVLHGGEYVAVSTATVLDAYGTPLLVLQPGYRLINVPKLPEAR